MADTVRVQFSASIGALIKGVEEAKTAIDSVRESTDRVTEGAKNFLEAYGIEKGIEKLTEFVGEMAELGEQIERTSAMLGTSTKETQELGFVAKVTGGSAEGLATSMQRLELNLQRAQDPTSQQALALQALGLSAKNLIGIPVAEQLDRIADAVAKFADGGNKTAIVMALLRRTGAQMIPVLDQGSAGLDRLRQTADDAGIVLSQRVVENLSAVRRNLATLQAATTSLGAEFVGTFAPQINEGTTALTRFVTGMSAAIKTGHTMEIVLHGMALAADMLTLNLVGAAKQIAALKELGQSSAAQTLPEIDVQARAKPQAPALAIPNRDAISAQMEQFQSQIKLYDAAYKQTQEILSSEVKLHQITYDQETQLLLGALDRRHTEETAALSAEAQIGGLTTAQYQKIVDQKLQLDEKYASEHRKIVQDAAVNDTKEWQSALQPIVSAWDSQLKKLLSGTETWGQAMKAIFADLVMDAIKKLEELAVEKAAAGLATVVGGGPQSLLGGLLGGSGQAAAQTANTTAIGLLTTAVGANTIALGGSAAASAGSAASGAAGGIGGLFSFFKTLLPGFDVGSWSVPHDMPAMIHQGETILPAQGGVADAFRSGQLGGGGGGISITGPVIGTQAFAQSMTQMLARTLQSYQSRTPSMSF